MTLPGQMPGKKLHEQDRLATGNPVYNGASNAATMGMVDPVGYVDRERRSGLAAQMLGGRRGRSGIPALAVDPSEVGQTASRMDRRELVRRLAVKLNGQES